MERTSLQWPDERRALGDECPTRAEAEQPDAFVRGASTEKVAHKVMPSVIRQANDRNCSEERERVLRDPVQSLSNNDGTRMRCEYAPLPAEDDAEHDPEEPSPLVVERVAKVQGLEQVDDGDVRRVERVSRVDEQLS